MHDFTYKYGKSNVTKNYKKKIAIIGPAGHYKGAPSILKWQRSLKIKPPSSFGSCC